MSEPTDTPDPSKATPPEGAAPPRQRNRPDRPPREAPEPARVEASDATEIGELGLAIDDTPEPEEAAKPAARIGRKVVIWNHTKGIRPGLHSIARTDGKGKPILDGAGRVQFDTIQVFLLPGLNLVDAVKAEHIREGLKDRIAAGEIEYLAGDVKQHRIITAIGETGSIETLLELASVRDTPRAIMDKLEEQLAKMRSGGTPAGHTPTVMRQ